METNIAILEKKAIDAALKNDWDKALELNTIIVSKRPLDISAWIRLGKSQLQTKHFKEAVKTFKKVLEIDPVNNIAKKNLAIAKDGKVLHSALTTKKLIKEPGTTTETQIVPNRKNLSISAGELFELNIKKKSVDITRGKTLLGTLEDKDLLKSLNTAKENHAEIEASFIKEKNGKMTILLTSSLPVFKSDRQDVKPYFKKGSLDEEEPELELSIEEPIEE
jgi:tetratricopeptide (TPR) repeat protein